ncbi:TBC1 domain family member 12-like isoform X2 [Centroberyx gerrardi]
METTGDGSSPPAVTDTEESSAHLHHLHHQPSSSAGVTDRRQTGCRCAHRESCCGDAGEEECLPAGSGALPRCVRPGAGSPAVLGPVPAGTGETHGVSDVIYTGLSRSTETGGDGSLDGQTGRCCDRGEAGGGAGPDPSDVTCLSDADRTGQSINMQDGNSSTQQADAVSAWTEGSEVSRCNGLDGGRGSLPNGACVSQRDGSSGQHSGVQTGEQPDGGLVMGEGRGRGAAEPQAEASLSSAPTCQGTTKPTPPSSNGEDDKEAEEEAALDLGPSRRPAPAPRSLPCSVSCDSAPLSPGSGPEAGSDDEAFAEPVPGRQQSGRFLDVGPGPRNTYECSRRQSAPGQLPQGGAGAGGGASHPGADPEAELQSRRPGIVEYLGRGVFSRKQRSVSQSVAGWKLFGKIPPRESPTKDSRTIQQEYESRQVRTGAGNSPTQHAAGRSRKNLEFEPLSTTALILEDRPPNLPAKSVEETQRHRQQYDEMVAGAKRRELKEAQRRQKQIKERFRQEESIATAMLVWNNDILPHWDNMRSSRRARELWWQGLPPNVRGRVWSLAIGNELNITAELYGIFLSRAKEKWRNLGETENEADGEPVCSDRESSLELITLDISRTFSSLCVFQKGGPYHDLLQSILGAYTCYRPDVGYVQGMSFIAAVLILNLDEVDAFISFSNLINKPCQMAFYRVDHQLMLKYFGAFEVFFEENLPRLFLHFQSFSLTPDLYLLDWILSLYTKPLPLDVACRVWDVFCRDGEEFLFRTGLALLRLHQDVLLQLDLVSSAQFLSRLPDEELLSDRLFSCIAATPMLSGNRKWSQVFSSLMKDSKEAERSSS